MAAKLFRCFLPAALFLIAACSRSQSPEAADDRFDPAALEPKPSCEAQSFEGSSFTVCRFDARSDEIRLAWRGANGQPLRSLAALEQSLGQDRERVRFAMNAGMYDEKGAPIGLFIEAGKQRKPLNLRAGSGNFHLLPNGVFAVDRRAHVSVTPSPRFRNAVDAPRWATQSGPMLVIRGKLHPKFDEDGPSKLVRNGVGVRDPSTAFFVISEEGVSFGRFARFFRDALHCPNALFLDGSVSSLWDPGAGRQDAYSELGPMVVVLRRQPSSAR